MPDATTPNLALPLLQAAQAQKHVTHNEALVALDTLVQLAVLDKDLTAPPASPAEGDRYLIAGAAPTGAWAGFAGRVVRYQDGAWRSFVPRPGWLAFVADEAELYTYTGVAWASFRATLTALQNLTRLGIGTTADAANPFSAKLNKALWTALAAAEGGTGDLRYTLNKEAAGNVLSLLFQSGFSGRAELGLAGDDDLRLKVSADGSSWRDALRVDRATGTATLAGLTVSAIPVFPGLSLSGTAGSFRTLAYQTNGSQRFTTFVSQEPETGGNSGSHFAISRHGDTGAFLDNPLVISRTTGQTALQSLAVAGPAAVGGRLSVGSTSNPADAVLELATGQGGASRPWRLLHKGGASTAWPNYGLAIVDAYDFDGSGNVALGFDWSTRNVGIGVTSASAPAYRLDVRGNMGVSAEAVIGGTLTCGNQTSQYGTGLVIRESAHASGSKRAAAYFGNGWALLQDSAGSGVRDFVLFNLVSSTQALAVNPSNNALTVNGPLIAGTTIKPGTYIVSTLPAGAVGAVAYASNGRKLGEAANSGTGVLVCFSNGNWRRLSDDSPVAA